MLTNIVQRNRYELPEERKCIGIKACSRLTPVDKQSMVSRVISGKRNLLTEETTDKYDSVWQLDGMTHLSMVPNSHLGSLLKGIRMAWNLAIFSATSAEMLGSLSSQVSSLRLCGTEGHGLRIISRVARIYPKACSFRLSGCVVFLPNLAAVCWNSVFESLRLN